MKTRTIPAHAPHARSSSKPRTATPGLFRLDEGYVVLDEAAATREPDALSALAREWGEYHVIAITGAPAGATAEEFAALGGAAQAFDRIVICESPEAGRSQGSGSAAAFARAVRGAGRTECHVVADPHRALRHCIESMVPGEVVAYCCGDLAAASRILAEYGAVRVGNNDRDETLAGIHVAPSARTGQLTAA